jgi:hypothetical protein
MTNSHNRPVPSPRRGGLGKGEEADIRFPFPILDFGFWIAQARSGRWRGFVPPIQNPKSKIQNPRRPAFTLFEVVLAIGLTATVVYLLTTAMELYMSNVEASRSRVETAQLARTLFAQIANDLKSARLPPPAGGPGVGGGMQTFGGGPNMQGPGGPGGPGGGGPGGGGFAGGAPSGGGGFPGGGPQGGMPNTSGMTAQPGAAQGVIGALDQLRIDRSAYTDWERATRELAPQETASRADMPVTVRYFLVTDNRVAVERLAQQGIARPYSPTTAAGLYRETIPTAAIQPNEPPLLAADKVRTGAEVELLAPEVVALELTYFDGTAVVESWDPAVDGGLPRGVEILLTIAQPQFNSQASQDEQQRIAERRFRESELIEFRRFVALPLSGAGPAAQALLQLPAAGGQGQGGQGQGGQGGGGQGGGGQGGGGGGFGGQGGGGQGGGGGFGGGGIQ